MPALVVVISTPASRAGPAGQGGLEPEEVEPSRTQFHSRVLVVVISSPACRAGQAGQDGLEHEEVKQGSTRFHKIYATIFTNTFTFI